MVNETLPTTFPFWRLLGTLRILL